MRIPVFVSCPTVLRGTQAAARAVVLHELAKVGLEPRALGRSDYPTELPLREVVMLARHCSGGVILGFEQFRATAGVWKRGTAERTRLAAHKPWPTPWNHLEAGVLFSLDLPLLVFREPGITGGIFDEGVTDVFVHPMPTTSMRVNSRRALSGVFQKWQASVRAHYYR